MLCIVKPPISIIPLKLFSNRKSQVFICSWHFSAVRTKILSQCLHFPAFLPMRNRQSGTNSHVLPPSILTGDTGSDWIPLLASHWAYVADCVLRNAKSSWRYRYGGSKPGRWARVLSRHRCASRGILLTIRLLRSVLDSVVTCSLLHYTEKQIHLIKQCLSII